MRTSHKDDFETLRLEMIVHMADLADVPVLVLHSSPITGPSATWKEPTPHSTQTTLHFGPRLVVSREADFMDIPVIVMSIVGKVDFYQGHCGRGFG